MKFEILPFIIPWRIIFVLNPNLVHHKAPNENNSDSSLCYISPYVPLFDIIQVISYISLCLSRYVCVCVCLCLSVYDYIFSVR